MCLDIVNVGLLQVSQVAEAHFGISYRQVNREHLPEEGWLCKEVNLITPPALPNEKIS